MVAEPGTPVRVCAIAEIPEGAGRVVRAEDRAIALFRVADEVFALDNVCPHWQGPLSEGIVSIDRLEVTCPWHRFRYDLRTGRNVLSDVRQSATVYPVDVRDGNVFVRIAR